MKDKTVPALLRFLLVTWNDDSAIDRARLRHEIRGVRVITGNIPELPVFTLAVRTVSHTTTGHDRLVPARATSGDFNPGPPPLTSKKSGTTLSCRLQLNQKLNLPR